MSSQRIVTNAYYGVKKLKRQPSLSQKRSSSAGSNSSRGWQTSNKATKISDRVANIVSRLSVDSSKRRLSK